MLKFQRKVLACLIVLVENVLIEPIQEENNYKKENDKIWIVE